MIKILRQFIDMAGKFRVFVKAESGEVFMFKFNEKPTEEQLETELQKQSAAAVFDKEAEIRKIDEEIKILTDRKVELEKVPVKEEEIGIAEL